MGLFGKKSATAVIDAVPFERERALPVSNVHNLQDNLKTVAAKLDWPDRTVPSPVMQTTLRPGRDTYGHDGLGIWVGKTCIGYIGRPASGANVATSAAVVFEDHRGLLIAFACPAAV